ncbi:MAG: hypothetical protein OHK0039_10960 [Bacteroidia bacterium]
MRHPRRFSWQASWLVFWLAALYGSLHAQGTFNRVYGGDLDEQALSVVQTRDEDYVLVGFTFSYGAGKSDVWVQKTDPYGEALWRQYLGGPGNDWASDLVETRDGNYVLAGYTHDPVTDTRNAWVVQLNRHGEQMWSRTYGGDLADEARALVQTRDGGFAVAGYSQSFARGKSDIWLLRLDATGNQLWQRTYGGQGIEQANAIIETRDEGFLIGGYQAYSEPNKADMLLVRTDRHGKGIWRRALPSPGNDAIEALIQTPEGHYLAAGWGYAEARTSLDARLVAFDASGQVRWTRDLGSAHKDVFYDIVATADGGYALAGQTEALRSNASAWLVKLDRDLGIQWEQRSRGDKRDWGHALAATRDGGFVLAGGTYSFAQSGCDVLLVKTDARGYFGQGPLVAEVIVPDRPDDTLLIKDPYKPDLYILAVGVSQYQDSSIRLTYAHSDAGAVARKFALLQGSLYNHIEVRTLLDEEATLVNIRRGIDWLERQATQKDMILVFFSSHGALDHKGNLYLLPHDFDAQSLFATGLHIRDLVEGMNAAPCKKLILLDACHSGQSGYDLMQFAAIKALDLNGAVSELAAADPGLTVMTSSSGREFSFENPRWGHGAFTKALLEGLDGAADFNQDRIIRLLELNLYVTERVRTLTDGRQHPFTPINLFGDLPIYLLP